MGLVPRFTEMASAAALGLFLVFAPAQDSAGQMPKAPRVGTALVLCVDTSGSIDARERELQIFGIAAALKNRQVRDAILTRGLAIKFIEFDTTPYERIDWTVLRTEQDINAYIKRVEGLERVADGGTHIDVCTKAAIDSLEAMPVTAESWVIDVSGDEFENSGPGLISKLQERAEALGIRINGLPILATAETSNDDQLQLVNGYGLFVKTKDGFIEIARGFADFERAMTKKFAAEIAQAPTAIRMRLAGLVSHP